MQPFVYGLIDPADPGHVRYVGMAGSRVGRPYDHSRNAEGSSRPTYLFHWVRKLHAEGREYDVMVLEQMEENASRKLLGFVEQCYIRSLREIGHRLTNVTDGGDGGGVKGAKRTAEFCKEVSERMKGRALPADVRAKIAATLTGNNLSKETRNKIAASHTGMKRSDKARANMRVAQKGRTISESHRAKISSTLTGRTASEETRKKQSIGIAAAQRTPEARTAASEKQRKVWAARKAVKEGV